MLSKSWELCKVTIIWHSFAEFCYSLFTFVVTLSHLYEFHLSFPRTYCCGVPRMPIHERVNDETNRREASGHSSIDFLLFVQKGSTSTVSDSVQERSVWHCSPTRFSCVDLTKQVASIYSHSFSDQIIVSTGWAKLQFLKLSDVTGYCLYIWGKTICLHWYANHQNLGWILLSIRGFNPKQLGSSDL